jgi:hypothetical protein
MLARNYWYVTLVAVAWTSFAEAETERIDLSAHRDANDLVRVTIQLEAGGHNVVRPDANGPQSQTEQKLPMSVSAKLEYDERRLNSHITGSTESVPLAVRYYHAAEAVIKVEDSGRTPKLDDERRLIIAESNAERPTLYCPDGPLTREQLDLIDVLGDSLSLESLLPASPVSKDQTWSNDSTTMGPFLTLDSVAVCEVKSVLESFNANFAKIRLAGSVQGTADGAATELEVRAVYLYDRKLRRVTQLNMAVRERRSVGAATPGVEGVAKLQIRVEPLNRSEKLSDAAVAKATAAAHAPARDLVFESAPLGLRCEHDRHWFVTSEQRESVTLRRVERGDLVAQCTLAALPAKSAGRQTSLEQFQKDVTFSLGKSFGEMVSSREWQNAAGLYCYELVARGFVEEVPVEWHYYLLAPESGERVSAAVTLEKPMVERVGQADRALIESIKLFPRMPAVQTAQRSTSDGKKRSGAARR